MHTVELIGIPAFLSLPPVFPLILSICLFPLARLCISFLPFKITGGWEEKNVFLRSICQATLWWVYQDSDSMKHTWYIQQSGEDMPSTQGNPFQEHQLVLLSKATLECPGHQEEPI